jgi:hypothetical protein
MRKKTTSRARKQDQDKASSCEKKGLIATDKSSRRSAGTESALDNRSHRTPLTFLMPPCHVLPGAAGSDAISSCSQDCHCLLPTNCYRSFSNDPWPRFTGASAAMIPG